jgi:hypothetical protein
MSDIEIREGNRRLESFRADIDPDDEAECVALLRRRAKQLRRPVERLVLITWTPRHIRRTYRA